MPRIRSIKPEFWSSPSLPTDPWARLLYIAMWNWADDNGIGTAIPRELLGFAFPNDEHLTLVDLRRMLEEIHRVLEVDFYAVAGRPYYCIRSWEKHQKFDRRSGGKHPGPELAETWLYQQEHAESRDPIEGSKISFEPSGTGTGEQGNRGTEEQAAVTRESATANSGGEDEMPLPPEPDDDWAGEADVIPLEAPRHVETGTRPRKAQPTQAARTLVRQVIPGLTREVTDQLANHVVQAARDGTPDTAIRTGLERWRDDPDRPKPGALPYRIGDAARDLAANPTATPVRPSKQRGMAEMLAQARAEEAHQKAAGELE